MQIVIKGATPPDLNANSRSDFAKQQDTKARAIAAFNAGNTQPHQQPPQQVVQNQSQVSVEELGAVKAQSNQHVVEEVRQNDTIVDDTTPAIPEPNIQEAAKTVEDPLLSRKFAQLAKQERTQRLKLQQSEATIKAKEAEIAAREAALATKEQEYKQGWVSKQHLKANPLQALTEAEISYDEIVQQAMETPTKTDPKLLATISKLEAKIQQLQEASEQSEKTYKTNQQQAYDSAVKQIRMDVDSLVNTDPNFETIKATKSNRDVVELIVKTYEQDGVLMTVEEAANEVENHILEEAIKLSRLNKVSKRMQTVQPASTSKPQQTQQVQSKPASTQQPQQMKTLTNAAASSRPLTARERAIAAFKGELK